MLQYLEEKERKRRKGAGKGEKERGKRRISRRKRKERKLNGKKRKWNEKERIKEQNGRTQGCWYKRKRERERREVGMGKRTSQLTILLVRAPAIAMERYAVGVMDDNYECSNVVRLEEVG